MHIERERTGLVHRKLAQLKVIESAMGWALSACALHRVLLGALCALAPVLPASADTAIPPPTREIPHTQPPASEVERLLVVHNAERTRLGLPALTWNASLASDAGAYASVLLNRGRLRHATNAERKGNGENLWMGTAGAWDSDGMFEMFLQERRYFRAATFPHISLTGNWSDVGHYSQIVWRDTREVGCAIRTGRGVDVLVCRYHPAGNVMGKAPY